VPVEGGTADRQRCGDGGGAGPDPLTPGRRTRVALDQEGDTDGCGTTDTTRSRSNGLLAYQSAEAGVTYSRWQ